MKRDQLLFTKCKSSFTALVTYALRTNVEIVDLCIKLIVERASVVLHLG